ncbi:hypothetical protein A4X13_0g8598 [Tilletia indica]|uniref:Uncharacterized protein n=1 Tax=Tilletia indica TaxID=43049 RepID=A0A8T8SEK5_9BASI|nr:hypothetical protein A4X13_0g8598 [Tilletia indica]
MVHIRMLIALLPFLVSATFALPLEGTLPGRSPTALHPNRAIPQPNSRDVCFALPGKLTFKNVGTVMHFDSLLSSGRLDVEREGSSDSTSLTYLSAEAAKKGGLLMRGDPPLSEGIKYYDMVAKLAKEPNTESNEIIEALHKAEQSVAKVMLPLDMKVGVAQPGEVLDLKPVWPQVQPPFRFYWPEERLNFATSHEQPSTSGRP